MYNYIEDGQQKNWPSFTGKDMMQFKYVFEQPMATSLTLSVIST
jgi:hypothetical protein